MTAPVPPRKGAALPPWAARDATSVVPGGAPQSIGSDLLSLMYGTDPFRKGSVAEERARLEHGDGDPGDVATARTFSRPASGANPPAAVPVGQVPAARGMLAPTDDDYIASEAAKINDDIKKRDARRKRMRGGS